LIRVSTHGFTSGERATSKAVATAGKTSDPPHSQPSENGSRPGDQTPGGGTASCRPTKTEPPAGASIADRFHEHAELSVAPNRGRKIPSWPDSATPAGLASARPQASPSNRSGPRIAWWEGRRCRRSQPPGRYRNADGLEFRALRAPPAGFAADALAGRTAGRTPPDYGWFCSDVGAASTGTPHPLAGRCGREPSIESRRSPQAVGNAPPRRLDRSGEHELSRGHLEVECLPATAPLAVSRRHHTRRCLNMGGSGA
jgi:hypothetical protein